MTEYYNSHQFAVDRLGQLNSHAVDTVDTLFQTRSQFASKMSSRYEPGMFSATQVGAHLGACARPEAVPHMKHVARNPSHIPGYKPDTHPPSLDILLVYAIVQKLQMQVQNMEQEIIKLRAKMCHCHDSMNRQMHSADSVTQPNNGDHNGNAQSMQASEEIAVSPEHGSVDRGSLQEQVEAPAMSAE